MYPFLSELLQLLVLGLADLVFQLRVGVFWFFVEL